ncbi:MAG: type IV pilus assembly protein PilM [Acidimicrobiia bacterium]
MTATVGLDIGTSAVRAAVLHGGKKGAPVLRKYGEVGLPAGAIEGGEIVDPAVVEDAIARLWKTTKLPKKGVVMGLANQRIIVRRVEVPEMSDEALRAALPQHVGEHIPMATEDAVLDFVPLEDIPGREGEEARRAILVVAAQKDMVNQYVDVVESAGIRVEGVDLQAFALVRAVFGARIPLGDAPVAVVSLGAGMTQVMVTKDGTLRFLRLIPIGGSDMTKALSNGLGITPDEAEELKRRAGVHAEPGALSGISDTRDGKARDILTEQAAQLIEEIRGTLEFFNASSPDAPVGEVMISGNAARLPHLATRMAMALDVTVTPVKLLGESIEVGKTGLSDEQLAHAQPVLPVAVGLAEWGLV